ncbi:N-acyl-L-amino acid amidohydrolase [Bryobacterales bacterium F-183]|nr:N-acyl-L-amino acid amidohydrolase [Bryobacterales bacterium F-183]
MLTRIALPLLASLALQAQQPAPNATEKKVSAAAKALEAALIETRREFHMNPELSNREVKTGQAIAARLKALGFDEVKTGIARTGVIGILKGGKPGPVVAWRADIDALPVISELKVPYKSKNPGVHHACGHDAHITIALGAAEILSKMRADIPGTIKFIFQPAEEGAPKGEEGGASLMIKEGALQNPRPAAIFGLHITTWLPSGKFGVANGPLMAAADTFDITLKGKQVHGATPHLGTDTTVVAAECITALQTIRSRRIDPLEPMVLTIGSIHGGNRHNIITGEIKMQGTLRTFNEGVRESVRTMMKQTLQGCTSTNGASYTLEFQEPSYPVTTNPAGLYEETIPVMKRLEGDNVIVTKPVAGAEDFSYFQREIPGFFWFLGSSNEAKGITAAHHTPDFNIDEDVLVPGVRMAVSQLLDYLERHK